MSGTKTTTWRHVMVDPPKVGDAQAAAAVSFDTWCTLEPLLPSLPGTRHTTLP